MRRAAAAARKLEPHKTKKKTNMSTKTELQKANDANWASSQGAKVSPPFILRDSRFPLRVVAWRTPDSMWEIWTREDDTPGSLNNYCIAGDIQSAEEADFIMCAMNSHLELLRVLAGCAAALHEAGKDFAVGNPLAVRPNLFELHEQAARAAIAKAQGGGL